jgi:hypothetical protein
MPEALKWLGYRLTERQNKPKLGNALVSMATFSQKTRFSTFCNKKYFLISKTQILQRYITMEQVAQLLVTLKR